MKSPQKLAFAFAIAVSLFSAACVRSPVPEMAPAQLESLELPHMLPRSLKLSVKDERAVSAPDKEETEKRVQRAFEDALKRAGVQLDADSTNTLEVEMKYPEEGERGMANTSCVEVTSRLSQAGKLSLRTRASGCAQAYNGVGMSVGPDASPAFQHAIQGTIQELDRLSVELNQLKELPDFGTEKIVVPALPVAQDKRVALVVESEIKESEEWRAKVERELSLAIRGAGYRLDPEASESLKVKLSRPQESIAGRDLNTCIEFQLVLDVARGTGRGRGSSCRGVEESRHHESFNEVLALVVSEIEKLPQP